MSDESTQLSVAELLARNGQGVPASGGGRRRRSGRGISVTELTGDMPAVREGSSSHAAPEPDAAEPEPEFPAATPDFDARPAYSPQSGPISYYDPLGTDESGSNGYGSNGYGSTGADPSGYGSNGYGVNGSDPNGYGSNGYVNGSDPSGYGSNGSALNGYGSNGSDLNGYGSNGSDLNGYGSNGSGPNGYGTNGSGPNGYGSNGSDLNGYGSNGAGPNGYGSNGSDLNGYGSNGAGPNGYGSNGSDLGGYGANGADLNGFGSNGYGSNGSDPSGFGGYGANGSDPGGFGANGFNGYGSSGPDLNGYNGGAPNGAPPPFEQHSYQSPAMSDAALREPTGYGGWPGTPSPEAPAPAEPDPVDPFAGPGGRRARRERMEAMDALAEPGFDAPAPDQAPGRRHRHGPADEATEVRPLRGPFPPPDGGAPPAWSPAPPPPDAESLSPGRPQLPRRNGAGPAGPANGLPAWSARRRPTPEPPAPPLDSPNGMPGNPDAQATAVWSLAGRDQQLVSGSTVAGDLLRDQADRRESGSRRGRAAVAEMPAPVDDRTDIYSPVHPDEDFDDEFDSDEYDLDDLDLDDDDLDDKPKPWAAAAAKIAEVRSRAAARAPSKSSRASRALSDDDIARKQWMVLGGQVAGAAVAGMLLFKGFEKMWDVLPFVALVLAMVVILGLVALVRVLRRTDDITSTVIAVVVGIFVTLGPLAFLLSTN